MSEPSQGQSPLLHKKRVSCATCKRRKIKCSGGRPCEYCIKISSECLPQGPGPKSVMDRVSSLERSRDDWERERKLTSVLIRNLQSEVQALRSGGPPPALEEPEQGPSGSQAIDYEDEVSEGIGYEESMDGEDEMGSQHEDVGKGAEGEDMTMVDAIRLGKRRRNQDFGEDESPISPVDKRRRLSEMKLDDKTFKIMEKTAIEIFFTRCVHKLPFVEPQEEGEFAACQIREDLLYWAIVAAGSREAAELAPIHRHADRMAVDKARMTLFGGDNITIEDLKGMLVIWSWLSEARAPGYMAGLALDFRLGAKCATLSRRYQAYKRTRTASSPPFPEAKQLASLLRLYFYLYMSDRWTAAAGDRPPLIAVAEENVEMVRQLMSLPNMRPYDTRMVVQVETVSIYSRVRRAFSVEEPSPDPFAVLEEQAKRLNDYYVDWLVTIQEAKRQPSYPYPAAISVMEVSGLFLVLSARMRIYAFAFRDLPEFPDQLSPQLVNCANKCVEAATTFCESLQNGFDKPDEVIYSSNLTQITLSYAAMLLLRMVNILPGRYDEEAIFKHVKKLGDDLSQISGQYYARHVLRHLKKTEDRRRKGNGGYTKDAVVYPVSSAMGVVTPPETYQFGTGSADFIMDPDLFREQPPAWLDPENALWVVPAFSPWHDPGVGRSSDVV